MASLSSVALVGHLTRDPELRYLPDGTAVSTFSLAVNRRFTKASGEKVEEVSFFDVTVWRRLAEVVAELLKKGRGVAVLGRLVQDRWEDPKSGDKRSRVYVEATDVQFLGGCSHDEEPAGVSEESPGAVETTLPAKPLPKPAPQKARR